jgi:hypothetical protein
VSFFELKYIENIDWFIDEDSTPAGHNQAYQWHMP